MIQLTGQYERTEVWAAFEHFSGSKVWPSSDPMDSPFDQFVCRSCGKRFSLQMYGSFSINGPNFEECALISLAEHLNIKHPR